MKEEFKAGTKRIFIIIAASSFLLASFFGIIGNSYGENILSYRISSAIDCSKIAVMLEDLKRDGIKKEGKNNDMRADHLAPKIGGGPCEYRVYKGKARILSVREKALPRGYAGPSCDAYEVKFSFYADEEIKEGHGKRAEGKEHLLLLTNSWYPGPEFIEKYGIKEGKIFDCYMRVIIKGTCTPILFDFPDIDLSDYSVDRQKGVTPSVDAMEKERLGTVFRKEKDDDEPPLRPGHPPIHRIPPVPMPYPPEKFETPEDATPCNESKGVITPDKLKGESKEGL